MVKQLSKTDAQRLIDQHRELEQEANEWRQWWHELDEWGDPRFGEMADRLIRFHRELAEHFKLEEASGSLDAMVDQHPDQRADVARIRKEHSELLAALQNLVDDLTPPHVSRETWGGARRDFEVFLDALHAHEAAEHDLGGCVDVDTDGTEHVR